MKTLTSTTTNSYSSATQTADYIFYLNSLLPVIVLSHTHFRIPEVSADSKTLQRCVLRKWGRVSPQFVHVFLPLCHCLGLLGTEGSCFYSLSEETIRPLKCLSLNSNKHDMTLTLIV